MTPNPPLTFRLVLVVGSLVIATLAAEVALRVWYRDQGRQTLGGPGGRQFEHDTIDGELRGRRDVGARAPGVPRIMVIGDSITYGLGVRDWRNTWPELLVRKLEAQGHPHQLAVFAVPGQDIPGHLEVMREWAERVAPDILIYQWYVNDIEAVSHRPDFSRPWQRAPWHETLRQRSYLYFILDIRVSQLLPPPLRSYVDYLLDDFAPGTMEWAEFERQFHEFAIRATHASRRRLMALYPQVPFRGQYALQPLHDRMRTLAGRHDLEIPPAAWVRSGASMMSDTAAPWKQVVTVPPRTEEGAIETPEYVFAGGPLSVVVVARRAPGEDDDNVATLQLIDAANGGIVGEGAIHLAGTPGALSSVTLSFTLPPDGFQRVRFRVKSSGRAGWSLAGIRVPVDYGFELLDLAQPLNRIATHASAFDAHPNEAAHRLMAEHIYESLAASPGDGDLPSPRGAAERRIERISDALRTDSTSNGHW